MNVLAPIKGWGLTNELFFAGPLNASISLKVVQNVDAVGRASQSRYKYHIWYEGPH